MTISGALTGDAVIIRGCNDVCRLRDPDRVADAFLDLLAARKIDPGIGGKLEDELLSACQLLEMWKAPHKARVAGDEAQIIRAKAGLHDFAAKVLAARDPARVAQFDEHLKLVAKGTVKTTLSQITENDPIDDAARKLVELYVACLAIHCGEDVLLDHPSAANGDNPDILLSYRDKTWALPIKTPFSPSGQTIFENIEKAAEQIERSAADRGLVVPNVRNRSLATAL